MTINNLLPSENSFITSEGDVNLSPERKAWLENNIDDNTGHWLAEDENYFLHQSLSTPCFNVLNASRGIYLEDLQGRKIMDFHGNNVHQVGFSNPYVIDAVKKQLDQLAFSPRRYTNQPAIELARKLTSLAPGALNKVLFAPGATTAIGMALKLARAVTGKYKTLSMWDSFHGASLDAISIGGEAAFRKGIGPLLPGTEHVLPVNTYRCMFGECNGCDLRCVNYLEYVLEKEAGDIGAVIMETVRNTDVQIPPLNYYQRVRELCDRYGALLILDETPIALGRTGKMFAFEHYEIIPDMVVIGKGLGGGIFPMSALLAKEQLNTAQHLSLGHYTHEKSPVGAAAALATLEYIEKENLLAHTQELGTYFHERLMGLVDRYTLIGDVRSIGLLAAVELVKDRTTKKPAAREAEKIMYACMAKGLGFKVSQGNVLTLSPALIITKEQLDQAIEILDQAIQETIGEA